MENPWLQLPKEPPFILPCDADKIEHFNTRQRDIKFKVILNENPSPYIGKPESSVIFLNLNPAYSLEESESPQIAQYQKIARMNLLHQFTDYPFYVLDPSLKGTPSGYEWFSKRFSPLMHATGMDAKELSNKLFLVEFFPYRSQKCNWSGDVISSQRYALSLIEKAISRRATIIVMRSEKNWFNALPVLKTYPHCYKLHSYQKVYISEKNLGTKEFNVVVEKLQKEN